MSKDILEFEPHKAYNLIKLSGYNQHVDTKAQLLTNVFHNCLNKSCSEPDTVVV
jgi:hypothetical protein